MTSGSQEIFSFGESHVVNVSILEEIGPKIYKNDFSINKFNFELNLENINEKLLVNILNFHKMVKKKIKYLLINLQKISLTLKYHLSFPKAKFLHILK